MGGTAFKMSGAGNDFLALIEPAAAPTATATQAWCRRGLSLGADGLFSLHRAPGGARMIYRNADGSRADLCLNGTRCAAELAFHLGWAENELRLFTDAGELRARRRAPGSIELSLPKIFDHPRAQTLAVAGDDHAGWSLRVGVPHFVLPWSASLSQAPVASLGPRLRRHRDLEACGANVHFVRFTSRHRFELRTFERGVEGETLACGTGVVAAAIVGFAMSYLEPPVTGLTAGGFELGVAAELEGDHPRRLELCGDARVLARLEIHADAGTLQTPAIWSP